MVNTEIVTLFIKEKQQTHTKKKNFVGQIKLFLDVLQENTLLVKGIFFDPAGKLFCTYFYHCIAVH